MPKHACWPGWTPMRCSLTPTAKDQGRTQGRGEAILASMAAAGANLHMQEPAHPYNTQQRSRRLDYLFHRPQTPEQAAEYSHSDPRSQPYRGKTRLPDQRNPSTFDPMNGGVLSTGYRHIWLSSEKIHAKSGG